MHPLGVNMVEYNHEVVYKNDEDFALISRSASGGRLRREDWESWKEEV